MTKVVFDPSAVVAGELFDMLTSEFYHAYCFLVYDAAVCSWRIDFGTQTRGLHGIRVPTRSAVVGNMVPRDPPSRC